MFLAISQQNRINCGAHLIADWVAITGCVSLAYKLLPLAEAGGWRSILAAAYWKFVPSWINISDGITATFDVSATFQFIIAPGAIVFVLSATFVFIWNQRT